jgi:hypothetical protein
MGVCDKGLRRKGAGIRAGIEPVVDTHFDRNELASVEINSVKKAVYTVVF